MAFNMKFDKSKMVGKKPQAPGLYRVRFDTFKPKWAKQKEGQEAKQSINFNAWCSILDLPDGESATVIANLNSQIPGFIQDFVHSFGVEMEEQASDTPGFPGIFDADPTIFVQDDPDTWRYAGPLVGKTAQWELDTRIYNGQENQSIRRFICTVPNCAERFPDIRHATDMAKKG